jgi:predicted transcriptional regulator
MHEDKIENQQKELSPEECEVVQVLEFYSQPFTLTTLARTVCSTEEQVHEHLKNLGLLDVVSKARIAERRETHLLARQAYEALARAAQEGR